MVVAINLKLELYSQVFQICDSPITFLHAMSQTKLSVTVWSAQSDAGACTLLSQFGIFTILCTSYIYRTKESEIDQTSRRRNDEIMPVTIEIRKCCSFPRAKSLPSNSASGTCCHCLDLQCWNTYTIEITPSGCSRPSIGHPMYWMWLDLTPDNITMHALVTKSTGQPLPSSR